MQNNHKDKNMITDFKEIEFKNSIYIKPKRVQFRQNNIQKTWDMVEVFDSVAVLLVEKDSDSFIVVKQFRPAVYVNGECDGYTYELCAGLVDKNKSLKQIAKEEILEECGYNVELDKIQEINSFYTSVGFAGSKQTLFFAEVSKNDKISQGGGIDLEEIEVVKLPIKDAQTFMYDKNIIKTPGLLYAFEWYNKSAKD